MGELVIGAIGVVVLLHLFKSSSATSSSQVPTPMGAPGQVPSFTPPPPVPTAPLVAPNLLPAPISSPYTRVQPSTSLAVPLRPSDVAGGGRWVRINGQSYFAGNDGNYYTYVNNQTIRVANPVTPTVSASPNVVGGIAGTVGSGGIPTGGALVPGISYGTGTTVIPLVY